MTTVSLLIVSNERGGEELRESLEPLGFHLRCCGRGSEAIRVVLDSPPHLLLIDARDEPLASLQLCRSLRSMEETDKIPLIVLSGSAGRPERLEIMEAGADDCWTEPVHSKEFELRLRGFERRFEANNTGQIVRYGDIELDANRYRAWRNGKAIDLTPMQLKLLRHLMENPSVVFTRKQLLRLVWENTELDQGAVTACIVRLRRALNSAGPNVLKRVPAAGYVLESGDATAAADIVPVGAVETSD